MCHFWITPSKTNWCILKCHLFSLKESDTPNLYLYITSQIKTCYCLRLHRHLALAPATIQINLRSPHPLILNIRFRIVVWGRRGSITDPCRALVRTPQALTCKPDMDFSAKSFCHILLRYFPHVCCNAFERMTINNAIRYYHCY